MFGKYIDYWLLRPFVHKRNLSTEEELDQAYRNTTYSLADSEKFIKNINILYGNHLPIDPKLSYLDIGCGMGRFCLGMAQVGVENITGIDIVPRNIDQAKMLADRLKEKSKPKFLCTDIHNWQSYKKYDIITVLGVMEHIRAPNQFIKRLPELLNPRGKVFIGHENFYGPRGDHLRHFFRFEIPWRGVLFSESALMKLRREFYRPTDPAKQFHEIVGGLNKFSYREFIDCSLQAGFKFKFLSINPSYKRLKPLHLVSNVVTKIPVINNYFVEFVYAVLQLEDPTE